MGEVLATRRRLETLKVEQRKLKDLWYHAQNNRETYYNRHRLAKYYSKGAWVILLMRNIKLKAGKLEPKFIGLFRILKYISNSAYKLELLSIYNYLYLTFHVSLLKEYVAKKGQEPHLYPSGELPELADNNKE